LLSIRTSYRTPVPNAKKFGPPAGSSNGIQLLTIVTVFGASGLTNAYRSVLSACGSAEISGASRWLDAPPGVGPRPANTPTAAAAAAPITARRRVSLLFRTTVPSLARMVCGRCATVGRVGGCGADRPPFDVGPARPPPLRAAALIGSPGPVEAVHSPP